MVQQYYPYPSGFRPIIIWPGFQFHPFRSSLNIYHIRTILPFTCYSLVHPQTDWFLGAASFCFICLRAAMRSGRPPLPLHCHGHAGVWAGLTCCVSASRQVWWWRRSISTLISTSMVDSRGASNVIMGGIDCSGGSASPFEPWDPWVIWALVSIHVQSSKALLRSQLIQKLHKSCSGLWNTQMQGKDPEK